MIFLLASVRLFCLWALFYWLSNVSFDWAMLDRLVWSTHLLNQDGSGLLFSYSSRRNSRCISPFTTSSPCLFQEISIVCCKINKMSHLKCLGMVDSTYSKHKSPLFPFPFLIPVDDVTGYLPSLCNTANVSPSLTMLQYDFISFYDVWCMEFPMQKIVTHLSPRLSAVQEWDFT